MRGLLLVSGAFLAFALLLSYRYSFYQDHREPEEEQTDRPTATLILPRTDESTAPGRSPASSVPLGSSIVFGNLRLRVLSAERRYFIGGKENQAEGLYRKAPTGKVFLLVNLYLENLGPPENLERYSYLNFRVLGLKGNNYDGELMETKIPGFLGWGTLKGGTMVTGTIVRKIDEDDSALTLRWRHPDTSRYVYLALE